MLLFFIFGATISMNVFNQTTMCRCLLVHVFNHTIYYPDIKMILKYIF